MHDGHPQRRLTKLTIHCCLVLACLLGMSPAARGQSTENKDNTVVQLQPRPVSPERNLSLEQVEQRIVEQTNAFRKSEGQSAVEIEPKLSKTAQDFADYMARTLRYGHLADGQRPSDRVADHGYDYCLVSENIAYQYNSLGFTTQELADNFVQGWKDSPGHRKNMLDDAVRETGVGVARGEDSGYYFAVQLFGRQKAEAITFQIINNTRTSFSYDLGDKSFPLEPRFGRTHQQCRPGTLTFKWPDSQQQSMTVKPASGEKLLVTRGASGEFRVQTTQK